MKTFLKILFCAFAVITGIAVFSHAAPSIDFGNLLGIKGATALAFVPFGVVDATRARAAYERIKKVAAMINATFKADIIVNEDYFWSEQVVNNTTTVYTFPTWEKVMQTQTDRPLQKGVNDNDIFMGISARLTIDHRVIGQSNVKPQSFPSTLIFTAANTGDAQDLYSIFNGEWSLQVGRTVYIPGETTRSFYDVPITQKTIASNESAFDGKKYYELDPYPVLSGKSDNLLKLQIVTYAGWAGASIVADDENVMTFEFKGITAQNAAGYVEYFTGEKSIEDEYLKKFPNAKM